MSTAATTTRPTADRTGARTEEAADVITGARERIDALDDRIIGLVQERMASRRSSRRPASPPAAAA